MQKLVGRSYETEILIDALASNRSELIAVYGRRRVGKTFLIRSVYKNHIQFEFSGINKAPFKQQLLSFHLTLSEKKKGFQPPQGWIEAFHQLKQYLGLLRTKSKKVIFIDEFPWLDTRKSNFLAAFDNFWNSYASQRDDLVVVICGSAAAYMIKKIIKSKGGLDNRLTRKIQLKPFNLNETELLLKSNSIVFSRYDILQVYMVMGGVPHYLEKIKPGESVAQTVDRLCFRKDGFLRGEFENIFASLFEHSANHEEIVRVLATVRKGMTRTEIISKIRLCSGGTFSKTLEELVDSGFVEKYLPYRGVKDSVYRLTDEYSLFYLKYMESTKPTEGEVWLNLAGQQSFKIWMGFSFENVCLKHIEQIKNGLKIAGIHSVNGSWVERNAENGAQIDLLIDRDDNVINLCEMKFYNSEFIIDKKYASEIARKVNIFTTSTQTKKSIFVTFITTYGLLKNEYRNQWVQSELTIEHLFSKL